MIARTRSASETEALGERFAAELGPGDVVLVSGDLGAGKTTLIRGAARSLGVTEPVTSPTFTIGHTYRGRVPVSHLDLYRLAELDQEDPALLDDYVTPEAVSFIEWPRAAAPWLDRITRRVELRHAGERSARSSSEAPPRCHPRVIFLSRNVELAAVTSFPDRTISTRRATMTCMRRRTMRGRPWRQWPWPSVHRSQGRAPRSASNPKATHFGHSSNRVTNSWSRWRAVPPMSMTARRTARSLAT